MSRSDLELFNQIDAQRKYPKKKLLIVGENTFVSHELEREFEVYREPHLVSPDDWFLIDPRPLGTGKKNELPNPPLGVTPEWRWRELRCADLIAAIGRYQQAEVYVPVPLSWDKELFEHLKWLQEHGCEKEGRV